MLSDAVNVLMIFYFTLNYGWIILVKSQGYTNSLPCEGCEARISQSVLCVLPHRA